MITTVTLLYLIGLGLVSTGAAGLRVALRRLRYQRRH